VLHPDDQIRIGDERQILQRFLQVTRTYLAGSPRPLDRLGQADLRFLIHDRSPGYFSLLPGRENWFFAPLPLIKNHQGLRGRISPPGVKGFWQPSFLICLSLPIVIFARPMKQSIFLIKALRQPLPDTITHLQI
jgi:hypothetical protein